MYQHEKDSTTFNYLNTKMNRPLKFKKNIVENISTLKEKTKNRCIFLIHGLEKLHIMRTSILCKTEKHELIEET